MARLVLPQALGKAAATYRVLPSGLVRPTIWDGEGGKEGEKGRERRGWVFTHVVTFHTCYF